MTDDTIGDDCNECGNPYARLMDYIDRQVGAACMPCGYWWTSGHTCGRIVVRAGAGA